MKPDKRTANATIKEISALHKTLLGISQTEEAVKATIAKTATETRRTSAIAELEAIDVDALNADKQGIRVSALKSAGITNMSQVCEMPIYRLTSISGIGEQTAKRIKEIADKMFNAVISSAKIQINPQKRSASQNTTVQSLYLLRNSEAARTQAITLLAQESNIEVLLRQASPASGMLKWLFSSKTAKNNSVQAFEYLNGLVNGIFGQQARLCKEAFNGVLAQPIDEAYRDYEKNAAAYYTLLEGLGLSPPRLAATGLSDELVSAVEQYPLDLTHMKTTLRHYQTFGAKYMLLQQKALLGDEMGLGKTMQALAAIADTKSKGASHFLVVCPASVLVNWQRETDKHTSISSIIIHGWDKAMEFEQWQAEGGVGITNFESLIRLADQLNFTYGALVVDEAHFVKNPEAQRTKALIRAAEKAERIYFMTGTPLENRVDEMCFLVNCLRPDIAAKLSTMKTLSATQQFKNEVAPVYLRRIRDDVLTELPDLIENEDWLEPNAEELRDYRETVEAGNFMAMRRVSWDVELSKSSKANRLLELCDEARDEGRGVIVFSFFRTTLDKVCTLLGGRALGPITGNVSNDARQRLVDEFTQAPSGRALVAQVQAGGVGLNIQAASVVVFCEPQIKPSLESQAISRAYRMGQVRNVHVHRLLCVDTVDEPMMKMLANKQLEFDAYADESVVGVESLREQSEGAWIREILEGERVRVGVGV
ncbi:MAG: SNF2-related protein [Defluviitaleaceae bacterium]|nr:SNF2-related protein [Defluviitaleaceae bacterium]